MTACAPQTFVIREECRKAAWQHGYRRALGESEGWAAFASTTARGVLHLAAAGPSGPWLMALDHPGVIQELGPAPVPVMDIPSSPAQACYCFPSLTALYAVLPRVYELAVSLPDAPLETFQQHTASLPRSTEAERLVIQRIGQDIFRASLLDYWQGRCPLTGITDPELLRASHIIPWSECADDSQRLDVHNGLLLSALWDAAFDRALVTFDNRGIPCFSPRLSAAARGQFHSGGPLPLTEAHREYLRHHQTRFQRISSTSHDGAA